MLTDVLSLDVRGLMQKEKKTSFQKKRRLFFRVEVPKDEMANDEKEHPEILYKFITNMRGRSHLVIGSIGKGK